MKIHMWGDTDFAWDTLDEAMKFIEEESKQIKLDEPKATYLTTDALKPMMKEKWGCIVYEHLYLWCGGNIEASSNGRVPNERELTEFLNVIEKAITKYPEIAPEIVDDLDGVAIYRALDGPVEQLQEKAYALYKTKR